MMDDLNITMEEYIKLLAEKAQRRGQMFNWETATYDKIYCDNLDFFSDFESDFPATVYNDASTSSENVSSEPTVSIYDAIKTDFDFSISFSDSDDEDYTFICDKDSFSYKLIHVDNLKPEPVNDHVEINTELCSKNIDIKPMDSGACTWKDTTPIEFALRRKRGAMISGGRFVACLAEHFGLLTEQRLQGLTIFDELDDTWASAIPAPIQAPQPPPTAASTRTMVQRLSRLKEDVHSLRGDMGEQREVLDSMSRDFARFTTWTVASLSLMMDRNGVRYTSYFNSPIPYQRRTRRRTDDGGTTAPHR
ncbi:hypothetical protein Tco_1078506 [Tanacetum coccineum]|uniref:Uncharacterized protein n=1 Tax=Tanacetum coccineum TaxID=301880 RepID=A0ABQ5HP71_9ASTR